MSGNTLYFNPLSSPILVMPKAVGATCNLNCKYCYYLEKEVLYGGKKNFMSFEMLEKFTEQYINAQPTFDVLFTWHGGEPLLIGIDFYKKALELQKKYSNGKTISNVLQTNGLLLNDEWCEFFKENNFLLGISLDGPEHCHDKYRLDKGGKGTFSKVMKGVELLQKHNVEFNVLSVVNNYNVNYPTEMYNFFKSIGVKYIQFSPVVERFADRDDGLKLLSPKYQNDVKVTDWSVPAIDFGKFLNAIFDEWIKADVGTYFVTFFDATLAGYVNVIPGSCVWAKSCGHAAAMEHNGDLYSCDHFVFPEYKIGNINDTPIVKMMLSSEQMKFGSSKYTSLPKQCKKCKFLDLCNGECPKNRIIKTADGELGLNYLCSGFKLYFNHTKPYMEFMANELKNNRHPMNVMRWAKTRLNK